MQTMNAMGKQKSDLKIINYCLQKKSLLVCIQMHPLTAFYQWITSVINCFVFFVIK